MKYLALLMAVMSMPLLASAQTKNGPYTLDRCYSEEGEMEPYKHLGYNLCSSEGRKKLDTIFSQVKKPNYNKDYAFGRVHYVRGDGSKRVVYNNVAIHKKTKEVKVIPFTIILPEGETPRWSFSVNSDKACLLNKKAEIASEGNHQSYDYETVGTKDGICFEMDEYGLSLYLEPDPNPIRF